MLKRRQDGRPKFPFLFQNSFKNSTYHGLWSKMPLGSLQEPAKSLPGASQEPFKGPQEAPKSLQEAPMQPPRRFRKGGLLHIHATAFGTTHLNLNAYVSAL